MSTIGLPARISYAVVAFPVAGAAGFYASIWFLPKAVGWLPKLDTGLPTLSLGMDGFVMFKAALWAGAAAALTASLIALTLPWMRRRKRRGRSGRIAISFVFVLVASLGFAGLDHALFYDLAFAAWLAYTLAFTFVRYGVVDRATHTSALAEDS